MLELRPNCELCDVDLPPDAAEARICTYECTFCSSCVATVLDNVCPNCGGGFAPRPIRPAGEWRPGAGLGHTPASTTRIHTGYSEEELRDFAAMLRDIPPERR